MSRANLRELLTAAVDGELTAAERKTAQRLLQESASARALFAQLKADSTRLKSLPRMAAPAELADNVMYVIRERSITPTPLPPARRASPKFNWSMLPIWVNLATAAGVLIVVSIGSYMYFSASHDYAGNRDLASRQGANGNGSGLAKPEVEKGPVPKEIIPDEVPFPKAIVQAPKDDSPELGPSPRLVVADPITGPLNDGMPEIEPVHLDRIRVSHLFDMHELALDEAARKKLADEMKKDELIRLDLFCQTTPKALEQVLAALKTRGIVTVTDAFVAERLKKKSPTEVMVFTEAMNPDEVAQLLMALGADDAKSGAGELETLVAAPFLPADLDRLGKLLGVPNVLPKPAKGKVGIDIRKPLPEGTANHVAATLAKMGSAATPAKSEKIAVVVAYSPMNAQAAASKEIKQFLDRRGERRADAKPLMLVLRTTSK